MAKSKVKVDISGLKRRLRASEMPVKRLNQMGQEIDKKVKKAISGGRSPVKGFGRYKNYAIDRDDAVGDYPRGLKNRKPINLKLSGDLLDAIGYTVKRSVGGISYGLKSSSEKLKTIFRVHNEGLRKDIPQRKILPTDGEESFTVDITKKIKDIYILAINDILKRNK